MNLKVIPAPAVPLVTPSLIFLLLILSVNDAVGALEVANMKHSRRAYLQVIANVIKRQNISSAPANVVGVCDPDSLLHI